ncbi:MAG: NAD(+) synthase [Blautia sp.]|nr:NAD(+) synthase [Blautia sp.]
MEGFVRIASAVPHVHIGNVKANVGEHIKMMKMAAEKNAKVVVFPELSLTGYTCADLFFQKTLLDEVILGLSELCANCPEGLVVTVGAPIRTTGGNVSGTLTMPGLDSYVSGAAPGLYNCAVVLTGAGIAGIVPKTYLPNTSEFYEKRWFESGPVLSVGRHATPEILKTTQNSDKGEVPFGSLIFRSRDGVSFGIELCEDLWSPLPPSTVLSLAGADVILNLSASNELIAKREYRRELVSQQSARCLCGYVYVSAGKNESTTDLVFSGHCLTASCGRIIKENENYIDDDYLITGDIDIDGIRADRLKSSSFRDAALLNSRLTENTVTVSLPDEISLALQDSEKPQINIHRHPFIPENDELRKMRCAQIFDLQANALVKRLNVTGGKLVVGISGGLDSTLALLAACKAMDIMGLPRTNILGVTMPCFGTTDRTHNNAWELMEKLGVTAKEVNIKNAVRVHLQDIGHDESDHSVTYENAQARERTQILMDLANDFGGIVLGTGDLSEIALGWCTYNADHMSMYGVNSGVPKTLVRWVVKTASDLPEFIDARAVLLDILDTPISPELLPPDKDGNILQQTEDLVGPYELHDFFLYYAIRYGYRPEKIFGLACIAFEGAYDEGTIRKWLVNFYRRFFTQQFKRSCMPDGVKIGSIALSPRGDFRMPSDAESAAWYSAVQ